MSHGRGHEPERTCIVCGKKQKKRQLLRLVLREDCVVIDTLKKLPGRGAYTCNNGKCLDMALKNYRNCLNRAFKTGRIRI
jgi:predicted RNA-binding protein YlxR (DUF448 family)